MAEAVMAVMAIKAPSSKAHDELCHKEPVHCAKRASAVRDMCGGYQGSFEPARAVLPKVDRHIIERNVDSPVKSTAHQHQFPVSVFQVRGLG